jgi:hypothetical protein
MQRLTGKRSIKTYEVAPKGAQAQAEQPVPEQTANAGFTFQKNDSLLEKMIKG